jgi:hypothetical protein
MSLIYRILMYVLRLLVLPRERKENQLEIDTRAENNLELIEQTKESESIAIIKDFEITKKYNEGFPRALKSITEFVVHHTAGRGVWAGLKKWMLGGERAEEYKRAVALFHFAIDKDGAIYQVGRLNRWFYHSSSGRHDKLTIGCELIHYNGPFTEEQYQSLAYLIYEYLPTLCPGLHRIVGHDYNKNKYSGSRKGCPGPNFDWPRLEQYGKDFGLYDKDLYSDCIDFEIPIASQYEIIRKTNSIAGINATSKAVERRLDNA